ncbi:hypothetical protein Taro_037205 [Colocasia esculenta]|uniref:Kinesin motor domain-containing protein n=1 Tax=Colocasia esculenta TaxID=4460 RepID=A0A843VZT1_COLES|nr:hypothetical protein [Colocasia esculenta]
MASLRRPPPRSRATEVSENDPGGPLDASPLPPPRSPLLCIPDPSQSPRKRLVCELDIPKVDHSQLWAKGAGGTPRSAQGTPTRALSRVHATNGVLGSGNGGRVPLHGGGRERGSSSRAVRAMADVKSCPSAEPEVRLFELDEDPSFWNDRNVQVLIRIRPINNAESASQGHGRCLRQESSQTLTWTGHPETRFTFDHVACETISQAKLFRVVGVPMVENCMSGYNSCMFAYGQTGSGKTHTMMGEIWEMDSNPCEDRGMTPRIFEYMFARIREVKSQWFLLLGTAEGYYNSLTSFTLCSYLEIYNEQITDLLDPSSTNLQASLHLREDLKKGVYVENLKEHDVKTVEDVIELLLQGTANRKMAATSMNSESSRSHSVFTCSIESQWEKDSMRHIRFGRLNLVDLAGSERQKSSGAEGERLKEAANINRSLSTLGLVIMTLVDIANGKHRHVPYRDSRLTFLLQDSLGGNSKTTIIANVSPSICSANETLSTLKFAQRAKLIQNNAKVNEDASGDVMALQREIRRLKMTFLESALAGTLRREKMAEAEISRLEAENEHMKQLVLQMEADVQQTKMMLHLRDETIRRLELQEDGLVSGNEYLMEKNNTLTQEIEMLQDKIDTNPELTQFAMENIKLQEQLRMLQDFYQKGEREILLNEISELRNEVECTLVDNVLGDRMVMQDKVTSQEETDEISECDTSKSSLHAKKSQEEAEAMRNLDMQFRNEHHPQVSQFYEMERIREQVEVETAQTILNLQEELAALQQELYSRRANGFLDEESSIVLRTENWELKEKLFQVTNKNAELLDSFDAKDTQINVIAAEWEKAIIELTSFLVDGCESLEDASDHINNIIDSFPQSKSWISNHVERAMKVFIEKEKLIVNLKRSLEDAQKMGLKMTSKLNSLKGATLAISEIQQLEHDETTNELLYLQKLLDEKTSVIQELENIIKCKDDQVIKAEKQANAAFIAIKRINEMTTKGSLHARAKEQMISGTGVDHPQFPSNQSKDCQHERSELQAPRDNCIGGTKNSSAENNSSKVVEIASNVFSQNALSQLDHTLQVLEQRIMETDTNCTRTREMLQLNLNDGWRIANEKTRQAAGLLLKFEEAQETMKEADLILNELMSANETARLETESWKHATQAMQVERASLASEVEQMRDAIVVDAKQNQILIAEVNATITEMPKLLSELEQMFQIMQNHTKSELKAIYSDIFSFASEMQECLRVSKIWSETLFRKIVHEKFPSDTLQQHQNVHEVGSFGLGTNPDRSWEVTEEKNGLEAESNLSQEVLNKFQKSLADIVSNLDTGNFERLNALCDLKDTLLQIAKLENGHTDIINDMNLVKEAISNNIMLLDQFITFAKKMSLQHQPSGCTASHVGNECTRVNALVDRYQVYDASILSDSSVSAMHSKLRSDIIQDAQGVPRNDDAPRQGEEEDTIDIRVLLNSIQQLRAHCDKLMLVLEKKRSSQLTIFNNKDAMLRSAVTKDNTKTQHGKQLMQAVDELGTGLVWLVGLLHSELDAEIRMDVFPSLLEMLFQGICSLEEKAHKFLERQSSDVIEQSDNLANLLSVKREQAPDHVHFRGVQESISTDKDTKHEGEGITDDLNNVQENLEIKITQVDAILRHQKELDSQLADSESALSSLRSELKDTKCALSMLVKENEKLVLLLEDVNREKMDAEEQLKDQEKLIMNLEREILCLNASVEERIFSSVEEIAEELRLVSDERDHLQKEIVNLNEKLDMTSALADENEAVAIEARQDAEASKAYAEEKEQEVKVLENSVEELEDTINMLEKKVYDMGEEVERYRLIREDLKLELQTLGAGVFTTAHTSENFHMENYMVEVQRIPRQIDNILQELSVSKKRIKDLENERACQAEEFQALEAMAYEVKTCPSISNHTSSVTNKTDKSSIRQRGSGSPFRCISSLVQQMNSEKDQELSVAKHRIEELEVLASDRQTQVCMLSARLAAVDNMTHDVIRDLLEVKLDMTNYANLIDLKELHKLLENGLPEPDQSRRKDEEILRLEAQINALTEEKDSWIEGRKADILATQEKLEKLQYRDQLLTAQNEMLKLDKANLTKRLSELDEVIKKIVGSQSIQELIQPLNVKESSISRQNNKLARRLAESDKLLRRAKNEPAWSSTCNSSEPFHQQQ